MHAKGVLEAGARIAGVWDPEPDAAARFVAQSGGVARPDAAAVLADRPDLVIALGRGPEAARAHQEAVEQLETLVREQPSILKHKTTLVAAYGNLGHVGNETADPAAAEEAYQKAHALLEPRARQHPVHFALESLAGAEPAALGRTQQFIVRSCVPQ